MIWEWLWSQLVAAMETLGGQLAALVPPVPGWISDSMAAVSQVTVWAGTIGTWVPWAVVGLSVGLVVLVMLAGLAIQLVRIVASFVTLGGGAT